MSEERQIRLKSHQDDLIFSDAPFPALGGGWGNGKTLAGCVRAWNLSEEASDNLGVIARKHFTDLRDSTLADFLNLFGGNVHFSKSDMSATLANGSKILFRHADKLGSLTNLNLGWFWIDQAEEVTEDAFMFLRGRLRRQTAKRRSGYLTFNMEGHNWIWRTWLKHLDKDERPLDGADYHLIVADTLANRDNLPEDYIRQILKFPERVRQRYVYGSWDVSEGQIYPMFSDQIHVIEPFSPPHDWTIFEMGDHGRTNPTAWIWGAVDFAGNLFLFDEHYLAGAPVSTHVQAMQKIRARYKLEPHELAYSVIDPNTKAEDSTGTTIQYQYLDAGLYPSSMQSKLFGGNNDVMAGINLVSEYLQYDPDRLHPITSQKGSPKLFITRNCINLIRELHEYRWQTLNNRSSALNPPEKPRKYNDHAVDALRYGVMSVPKTPEKQEIPGSMADMKTRFLRAHGVKKEAEQDPMEDYL